MRYNNYVFQKKSVNILYTFFPNFSILNFAIVEIGSEYTVKSTLFKNFVSKTDAFNCWFLYHSTQS
jgi:hypothetical protein